MSSSVNVTVSMKTPPFVCQYHCFSRVYQTYRTSALFLPSLPDYSCTYRLHFLQTCSRRPCRGGRQVQSSLLLSQKRNRVSDGICCSIFSGREPELCAHRRNSQVSCMCSLHSDNRQGCRTFSLPETAVLSPRCLP